MSTANELRASAARWPEDWPPQEHTLWEVSRAFLGHDEYMGDLCVPDGDLQWFLLFVACALDGGTSGVAPAEGTSNG
jgi:hypothetical protein